MGWWNLQRSSTKTLHRIGSSAAGGCHAAGSRFWLAANSLSREPSADSLGREPSADSLGSEDDDLLAATFSEPRLISRELRRAFVVGFFCQPAFILFFGVQRC
jgi:hypothetical protein